MGRIIMPDSINPGALRGDRLGYASGDAMAAPGRALQNLGGAITQASEQMQAQKDKMDRYNAGLAMERFSTDAALSYGENLRTSAPDGSDFVQKQEAALIKAFEDTSKTIKSPEEQQRFRLLFEKIRGDQVVKGVGDAREKGAKYVVATTGDSVNGWISSGAVKSKDEFNDYFENSVKPRIDSVIDDPIERQKYYAFLGTQMRDAYFRQHREDFMPKLIDGNVPLVFASQPGRVSSGSPEGLNPALLNRFKAVQNAFGKSVPIVSGYRSPELNRRAGGADKSTHLNGNAIDLDVSGMSTEERIRLIETASAQGITGIGVYKNSIHLDIGGLRAWGPDKHRGSVPAWAEGVISKHLAGAVTATPSGGVVPMTFDELWRRQINAESGGDPSAVSPAGAIGLAQIMPATGPEAARLAGEEWSLDRLNSDPAYNERLGRAYMNAMLDKYKDPAKALAAYNAGPGRVDGAILAGGKDWLSYMPAETKSYVAKILRGGTPALRGGRYETPAMPTGGVFAYMGADEWDKHLRAGRSALKDQIDLGIAQGTIDRTAVEQAPIDDGDKATLLRRWDEANKDGASMADFIDRLSNGGVNPKDSGDRKMADKLLDAAGGFKGIAESDPNTVKAMVDFYDRTGMVPDSVKGGLDSMLRSRDPAKVNTGLSILTELYDRNPRAFTQEFDDSTTALMQQYRSNLRTDTPADSVKRIMEATDPTMEPVKKERRKEAEKTAAAIDLSDVTDLFDPSILPFNEPSLTVAKDAEASLMGDYRAFYVKYFEQTGDDKQAKTMAAEALSRTWGVSQANRGMIMWLPPENTFRDPGMGKVNGSYQWLKDGVEKYLRANGYEHTRTVTGGHGGYFATIKEIAPYHIVATKQTVADFQSGKTPRYELWVTDEDGNYERVTQELSFEVDPARAAAVPGLEKDRLANEQRRKALDEALKASPGGNKDVPFIGSDSLGVTP